MEYLPGIHKVSIQHIRGRILCGTDEFEDMWKVYDDIESTPNPMNKKYMIKRKQCTFGARYKFAGQISKCYDGPTPSLVQKVLEDVKTHAGELSEYYNVVHTNFYPDGTAGLMAHADDESEHFDSNPIYSYTFLSHPGNPRGFSNI